MYNIVIPSLTGARQPCDRMSRGCYFQDFIMEAFKIIDYCVGGVIYWAVAEVVNVHHLRIVSSGYPTRHSAETYAIEILWGTQDDG